MLCSISGAGQRITEARQFITSCGDFLLVLDVRVSLDLASLVSLCLAASACQALLAKHCLPGFACLLGLLLLAELFACQGWLAQVCMLVACMPRFACQALLVRLGLLAWKALACRAFA